MPATADKRVEYDLLGSYLVPQAAYYGVHTCRAMDNFTASGDKLSDHPEFISSLAEVKQAAATANRDLNLLSQPRADAIITACDQIREGQLHDQFCVDMIQGGAGTSTNMNANEIIANRALELLGHSRGDYQYLHPLDDVNRSQSTNDVYPTAIKLTLDRQLRQLHDSLSHLRTSLDAKADEFKDIIKIGRTQLQDGVPMTLGQEFGAFSVTLGEDQQRLTEVKQFLHELNIGGTAIGTGLNAPPGYRPRVVDALRQITAIPDLISATDLIEATSDTGVFVHVSSGLKRLAVKLSKICNDLRLLASGPQAGFNEISLPAQQAGSSIMPGKINPVIPEMVNQIAFEVAGFDTTITLAAEGGQLQLNAFEPIISKSLFSGVKHLQSACETLTDKCITGITANTTLLREQVSQSSGLATALSPKVGHNSVTELAQEAITDGRSVIDLALDKQLLTHNEVLALLAPEALTGGAKQDDE